MHALEIENTNSLRAPSDSTVIMSIPDTYTLDPPANKAQSDNKRNERYL